jgi:hypothetical protein
MDSWFDTIEQECKLSATKMWLAAKLMRIIHYALHIPVVLCMVFASICSSLSAARPPDDPRQESYKIAAAILAAVSAALTFIIVGIDASGSSEKAKNAYIAFSNLGSRIRRARALEEYSPEYTIKVEEDLEAIRSMQPLMIWIGCGFCINRRCCV